MRENKAPDTQSYVPGNDVSPLLSSLSAPWYFVSNTEAVSIEHPYIIKNVEKGIESLGGSPGLNKVCRISVVKETVSHCQNSLS